MNLFPAFAALLSLWIAFAQVGERPSRSAIGDKGPATKAEINDPNAIALDGSRTLYIAENSKVIRRLDLRSGIISSLKTRTKLEAIDSLAVDIAGNLIATEFTVDRVITTGSGTT